jgi:glutathione S-transferase
MTKLVTITFSHYCEKARWALERCGIAFEEDGHLPIFAKLATRGSVPVLVTDDGAMVKDSTDIVAWADAKKPGELLPTDPKLRAEALALEDELDNNLGPAARRWGYAQLISEPRIIPYIVVGSPKWQARLLRVARPVAMKLIAAGLKINRASVERSRQTVDATFAAIADRLRDGRTFLVGDRFSVADLTFASLAAPVILPPQPATPMPPRELFAASTQIDRWRATAAGQFVLRMYANER